jgi:hypothetical protein
MPFPTPLGGAPELPRDDGLIAVIGAAPQGALDHSVDQPGPLPAIQPVGISEQLHLAGTIGRIGQVTHRGDILAVQLTVETNRLGDFIEPLHGARELPVDICHWYPIPGDDVPWADIAVAVHRVGGRAVRVPRHPHRMRWWHEAFCSVV